MRGFQKTVLLLAVAVVTVSSAQGQERVNRQRRALRWAGHPAYVVTLPPAPVQPFGLVQDGPETLSMDEVIGEPTVYIRRPLPRSPITGQVMTAAYNSPTSASDLVLPGVRLVHLGEDAPVAAKHF